MTVSSGTFPYEYQLSSWVDSDKGLFAIPVGHEGLIAMSGVHFEEAMYVAKAEYNRIHKQSGYTSQG